MCSKRDQRRSVINKGINTKLLIIKQAQNIKNYLKEHSLRIILFKELNLTGFISPSKDNIQKKPKLILLYNFYNCPSIYGMVFLSTILTFNF